MEELNHIYKTVLTLGLLEIRNAALSGDATRCHFEAEHLHNLPSLIGEENIERHLYYLNKERVRYVEACQAHDAELGRVSCTHSLERLVPFWDELLRCLQTFS